MTDLHLTSVNFFSVSETNFGWVSKNNIHHPTYLEASKYPLTSLPYAECVLSSKECVCFENEVARSKFYTSVNACISYPGEKQDWIPVFAKLAICKLYTKEVTCISLSGQDYLIAIPLKDLNTMINEAVKNNVASLDLDAYFTNPKPSQAAKAAFKSGANKGPGFL